MYIVAQVFRRSHAVVDYPDLAEHHPKPDFEIRYKKASKKRAKKPAADTEADVDRDRPVPLADDASSSFRSTSSASTLSIVSVNDVAAAPVPDEDRNTGFIWNCIESSTIFRLMQGRLLVAAKLS